MAAILPKTLILLILRHLDEVDLWNAMKSSLYFRQIIANTPNLRSKVPVHFDGFYLRELSEPDFYRSFNIQFAYANILNWRIPIRNQMILDHLNDFRDSIVHLKFRYARFEDFNELFQILQLLPKLQSLKCESCSMMRNHPLNLENIQLRTLVSISFSDCDENMYKFFHNQESIIKLAVVTYEQSWNGFLHEDFNDLAATLPSLNQIILIGEGIASYFDRNDFPFRIQKLYTETVSNHWYLGIQQPRINFLMSQLGNLRELKVNQLPYDFDGDLVLKFIIEDMQLETFYLGNIPLILNGQKQDVKYFCTSEIQIKAALEMLRQFPGIIKFKISFYVEDSAIEEIQKAIVESGLEFSSLKEFDIVYKAEYKILPIIHTNILKLFKHLSIKSFKINGNKIEFFITDCESSMTKNGNVLAGKKAIDIIPSHEVTNYEHNILSNAQIPIKNQYILEYPKNDINLIENKFKNSCKILKFTSDWKFEQVHNEINSFRKSIFKNLLVIIIDVEEDQSNETAKYKTSDEASKYSVKSLLRILSKLSKNRPFILQLTSRNKNETKLYYKDENSDQFHIFDFFQKQPANIDNFQNFLLIYISNKVEDFKDKITKALPNIKNLSLTWKFLKTLELPEDFFNKIILKCAAQGTIDQLITVLDDAYRNTTMKMNERIMNSIISMFKLDSSAEKSILSAAVENSNTEVMKYLVNEYPHLMKQLPFSHQVEILFFALKAQNLEFLCVLVESCNFPSPGELDVASVDDKILKIIVKFRQDFLDAVKTGHLENISMVFDKFRKRKSIQSIISCEKTNFEQEISTIISKEIKDFKQIIAILMAKISVKLTKENEHKYQKIHEKIKQWFQEIYEMKFGSALLKVVSSCNKLKIVFNIEHEDINQIDNIASDEETHSIALSGYKWILISAKDSEDTRRERRIRGIIAHEFCHYAVHLVFKNFTKPYYNSKNKEIQQMYQNIIRQIHRWLLEQPKNFEGMVNDEFENIILYTFTCYGEITADSIPLPIEQELIVRVVETFAYYHGNKDKIRELEVTFAPLIDFYAAHVNFEFENFNLEKQRIVTEFNEKTGILRELKKSMYIGNKQFIELISSKDLNSITYNKITIVTANIPKLFLYDAYHNINPNGPNFFETENIMIRAEQLEINEILEDLKEILKQVPKLNVFIDCTNATKISPTWHSDNRYANFIYIMNNQEKREKLIFSGKIKNIAKLFLNYSRNDLTLKSQNLLLSTKIFKSGNEKFSVMDFLKQNADFNNLSTSNTPEKSSTDYGTKILTENLLKHLIEGSEINLDMFVGSRLIKNLEYKLLYIDRKFLREKSKQRTKLTLNKLLTESLNSKYIILKDSPGAGKTWVMISIFDKIKNENLTKWVSYVDLKQFIELFQQEGIKYGTNDKLDFATFFAEHVMISKIDFEKELFKQLYKIGKVVILFDGFDEIAPDCAEFVTRLVNSFEHNGSNQLWIATRDNFEVNLEEKLKLDVSYKLSELNEKEGIKLISKIWALDELRKKNFEFKAKDEFLNKFDEINAKNDYDSKASLLIQTVLYLTLNSIGLIKLFRMLAYIGKDNMDSSNEYTIYSIYKIFISKYYDRFIHKKSQLRKESNQKVQKPEENFLKFHIHQAMKLLAPEFVHLCHVNIDEEKKWADVNALKCGLMVNENGKFYFIHHTFAEYFVALFATRMLEMDEANFISRMFSSESAKFDEQIIKFITKIIKSKNLGMVRIFMDGALGENQRTDKKEIINRFEKIAEHLDVADLILDEHRNILKLKNLGKFINLGFKEIGYRKVKNALYARIQSEIPEPKELLNVENMRNSKIIQEILTKIAESFLDVEVFEFLFDRIRNTYNKELMKKILKKKLKHEYYAYGYLYTSYDIHIIHILLMTKQCSVDNFQKIMKFFERVFTVPEMIDMMKETNERNENILHHSFTKRGNNKLSKDDFILIWQKIEIFFKSRKSVQMFRDFVIQVNVKEQNILYHIAQIYEKRDFYETLWQLLLKTFEDRRDDLWKFIIKTSCSKNIETNLIHQLVKFSNTEIIGLTLNTIKSDFGSMKFMEVLSKCDENGRNILHYAICWSSNDGFVNLITDLEKLLSHDEMRTILTSLNRFGQNLLQSATCRNKSLIIHNCLWKCYQKYFKLSEILNFITHCDSNGYNYAHYAARCNLKEVTEFTRNNVHEIINEFINKETTEKIKENINTIFQLTNIIRDNKEDEEVDIRKILGNENMRIFKLSPEQFQKHLKEGNLLNISTDLDNLAECTNLENHKISWKFILEKFKNQEELKKFMLHKSSYSNNYIHKVMSNENPQVIKFTIETLYKNFIKVQIDAILMSKGFQGRNLLQTAACDSKSVEAYKIMWNIFQDKTEIEDIVQHTDFYGNDLLLCAVRWSTKEVLKIIWNEFKNSMKYRNNSIEEFMKKQNFLGENVFHLSIKGNNKEKLEFVWTEIENTSGSSEFSHTFRTSVKQKDIHGNTILHNAVENCHKIEIHETLWNLLLKTFENHLGELWNLMKISNKDGHNFIYDLTDKSAQGIIKFTFKQIKDNFGIEKFLDILGIREQNGRYLIQYAACSSSHKNFELFIDELTKLPKKLHKISFLKS